MSFINTLMPSNFFPTIREDLTNLYAFSKTPKVTFPTNEQAAHISEQNLPGIILAAEQYNALEAKVYGAAYRVLGAAAMAVATLLAAKIILPILTFKFCLAVAITVGAFVAGRDIVEMARSRDELQGSTVLPGASNYKEFLVITEEQDRGYVIKNTLLSPFWKAVLPRA